MCDLDITASRFRQYNLRTSSRGTTMNIDSILKHINPEVIARDTVEFLRVKSETGQEGDGSQFLANLLRREGFDVKVDEFTPGRPNVYALIKGTNPKAPTLLFNGHT